MRLRALLAVPVAAVAAGALFAAPVGAATDNANPSSVVDVPVSFTVQNVNRTQVDCAADGKTYTVRGNMVAPASVLDAPDPGRAVTLYLHGLSFGNFFWNFRAVDGYDYARQLAQRGQTSVTIDRLGYNRSDKPGGFGICAGSRADVAHQIVQQLRSGDYQSRAKTPSFGKVFLAGHSYGGQISEIEAYSFGDVDGILVVSYTDVGGTALTDKSAAYAAKVCASGGRPANGDRPAGYSPFGAPSGASAALFNDTDPAVLKVGLRKLTLDPCGDGNSFPTAVSTDLQNIAKIDVPVLLVQGAADKLFDVSKQADQAKLFSGSPDVQTAVVPDAGHAVTLERTHETFVDEMVTNLQRFESRSDS